MKQYKYIFSLLLMTIFSMSQAQIDYPSLVRNLEEVTIDTKFETYFEGLSYQKEKYVVGTFKDERFLRYHGVIVDEVSFDSDELEIKLFDEVADYNLLLKKLTELYGDPEMQNDDQSKKIVWMSPEKEITMEIALENKVFSEFKKFTIQFKK